MLLSIIIPAHNVSKYIVNTLDSLKKQTVSDFEVIIVDDASTDNTQEIIEMFIKENTQLNIKLIKSDKNQGVSATRNIGIKEASGENIVFIDGDDFVDARLVEYIQENRKTETSELIVFGFNRINPEMKKLSEYFDAYEFPEHNVTGGDLLNRVAHEKTIQMCVANIVYNREFIMNNSLLYTEYCVSGEDTEFIYKSFILAKEVSFVHEVLFYYVIREGSITNSYNLKKFQTIDAVKRILEFALVNGDENEIKIIKKELDNMLIYRYTYNYNSCLSYLLEKKHSNKQALDILNADIDRVYPSLRKSMRVVLKNYSGRNKKIFIKAKTFRLSPILYNKLYNQIK